MPIVGLTLESEWTFESKHDKARGKPEATRFTLGTLDSRVLGHLRDRLSTIVVDPKAGDDAPIDTKTARHAVNFEIVQFALRGWENFADEKGKPIAFKRRGRNLMQKSYDIAHADCVGRIPITVLSEIAAEVTKKNDLGVEGNV